MAKNETMKTIKSNVAKGYQIVENFLSNQLKKVKLGSCYFLKSSNFTYEFENETKMITGIYDKKLSTFFIKAKPSSKKLVDELKEGMTLKEKDGVKLMITSLNFEKEYPYELKCDDKIEKVTCYKITVKEIK